MIPIKSVTRDKYYTFSGNFNSYVKDYRNECYRLFETSPDNIVIIWCGKIIKSNNDNQSLYSVGITPHENLGGLIVRDLNMWSINTHNFFSECVKNNIESIAHLYCSMGIPIDLFYIIMSYRGANNNQLIN
jgi:hypothetical protein